MPLAADTAGIPITTLRQWVECGKLPASAGNRGRLVRLADVQRLMASEDLAPGTLAATEDATVDQRCGGRADMALAARAAEQSAALQHLRAIDGNRVAFMARLDALYRAQVAAKNREIATKDELIVELERRAERA